MHTEPCAHAGVPSESLAQLALAALDPSGPAHMPPTGPAAWDLILEAPCFAACAQPPVSSSSVVQERQPYTAASASSGAARESNVHESASSDILNAIAPAASAGSSADSASQRCNSADGGLELSEPPSPCAVSRSDSAGSVSASAASAKAPGHQAEPACVPASTDGGASCAPLSGTLRAAAEAAIARAESTDAQVQRQGQRCMRCCMFLPCMHTHSPLIPRGRACGLHDVHEPVPLPQTQSRCDRQLRRHDPVVMQVARQNCCIISA